tara:strand:+ start:307 stop:468 length:162 start_codon:yes stop_codon:yes gene_type:complete
MIPLMLIKNRRTSMIQNPLKNKPSGLKINKMSANTKTIPNTSTLSFRFFPSLK